MLKKLFFLKIVKVFTSIKLTLLCLFLLFLQTLFGTFYQTEYGLYQAQQKVFYSWFFHLWGLFFFPGTKLVLWVLFVNLLTSSVFRFKYNRYKLGIITIHLGLLLLFVASGVTYYFAHDSHLTLREGSGTNVSVDYHQWEVAIWTEKVKNDSIIRFVEAQNIEAFDIGCRLNYKSKNMDLYVKEFYPNTKALLASTVNDIVNVSGIIKFAPLPVDDQSEANIAGVRFDLESQGVIKKILLFGGDKTATPISFQNKVYFLKLRRRHYVLPMTVILNDFKKKEHPGTGIAKSFESFVSQSSLKIRRDLVISMNNPMRYKDYTFFQTSFAEELDGEISTLTVVKNPGRLLPYISCLIVGLGLVLHFILMLIRFTVRRQDES